MATIASGGFVGTLDAEARSGDAAPAGASGQEALLARVDAHFGRHPLAHELCALPAGPATRPLRWIAVVRPRAAELSRLRVIQPVTRFREDLAKLACTFASPVEVEDVVCLEEPLPRARGGGHDRAAVAARVEAWREARRASLEAEEPEEARALARRPVVARFLERLAAVLETRMPLRAALHFERDLGLDSLAQVQLRALLEQEFGVVVPDGELWMLATVGDAMRRVAAANAPRMPAGAYDWHARLAEPAAEPFSRRFEWPQGLALRLRVAAMRALWRTLAPLAHGGEVRGLERLPASGPFLFAPTHQSLIDAAFVSPYRHVLSKGVHVALRRDARLETQLLFETARDADVMTLIPWGPVALWGPTETVVTDLERGFRVERADVDLLLGELNRHLARPVAPSDIVSLRCGVRSLAVGRDRPACDASLALSRRTLVHRDEEAPWVTVYGGKLTGCTLVAREAARALEPLLGRDLARLRPRTPPPLEPRLEAFPGLDEPVPSPRWCAGHEGCRTLEDWLRRRTNVAQWLPRGGLGARDENVPRLLEAAEAIHGSALGAAEAVEAYRAKVRREHDAVLAPVAGDEDPLSVAGGGGPPAPRGSDPARGGPEAHRHWRHRPRFGTEVRS